MSSALTGYPRRPMAQSAPRNRRSITHNPFVGLLCAMVLGFGVCLGFSVPVPDTIQLPDSLGPLYSDYHLAFGSSADNINPFVTNTALIMPNCGSFGVVIIYGLDGKEVKRIESGRNSRAPSLTWNGTNAHGNQVPAGVYVAVNASRPKNKTQVVKLR